MYIYCLVRTFTLVYCQNPISHNKSIDLYNFIRNVGFIFVMSANSYYQEVDLEMLASMFVI